jgi:hypothetical protein
MTYSKATLRSHIDTMLFSQTGAGAAGFLFKPRGAGVPVGSRHLLDADDH